MFSPASVLVRMPNWVGDCVMATPLIRSIRKGWPGAKVSLWTKPAYRELFECIPGHDEVLYEPKEPAGRRAFLADLRARRFDLAFVLPHSLKSALDVLRAGVRAAVGCREQWRGLLLTISVDRPLVGIKRQREPMVTEYLRLAEAVGLAPDLAPPRLEVSEASRREIDGILARYGRDPAKRLVGVSPGAAFGSTKMWEERRYAVVADELQERYGLQVVLVGAPWEMPLLERVAKRTLTPCINLSRETIGLRLLAALLERLDLLVSTDSGPRHIAHALGRPVLVLMGPTDPVLTNIHLGRSKILQAPEVSCAPCNLPQCPVDHRCMARITAQQVRDAAIEILDLTSAPSTASLDSGNRTG